jgi:HAMP domain-containing protein
MRQWWQRRSLRLRLTVWYALTSTIVLLALGGLMFFVVRGRLLSQLDRQLRGDFEMIESRVVRDQTGNLRWPGSGQDNDEVEWEKEGGPWFEILSPTGSILLREGLSSDWKPLFSLMPHVGGVTSFSAELQGHLHVRALANDTLIAGEPVLLRVFRSEAELRRAMAEFGAVLGFGLPLGVALSAVGGYLIAHRSLSPVSQIAARARQITAESLGGRLPVPNPHDELGQLATVVNATLARLENSFGEGPGIAPEHHQKIFERFYRVDKARSRASGGAGLGLAIARWAIERQRGHIELESKPGYGSLFRIVMPK